MHFLFLLLNFTQAALVLPMLFHCLVGFLNFVIVVPIISWSVGIFLVLFSGF